MKSTVEIEGLINLNLKSIFDNLSHESIDVYNFLRTEFINSNVNENYLFQFVYRSFYRLDNAGLTTQFKTEYFNLLQQHRKFECFDFAKILHRLYEIENHKSQNTFQFSFVSKMQSTIDPNKPIYDNEVATVFSFVKSSYKADFNSRYHFYSNQLAKIEQTYNSIIESNSLENALIQFDTKFQNNDLPVIKKLDFIFWTAGKLLRKEKKLKQALV